jgi:hypothetical protein
VIGGGQWLVTEILSGPLEGVSVARNLYPLSTWEVVGETHVPPRTIRRWASQGRLPALQHVRCGRWHYARGAGAFIREGRSSLVS